MVDFVKDGQVGDEVYDPNYGNGRIVAINEGALYAVRVHFDKYDTQEYTRRGKWHKSSRPLLCYGHREVEHLDQGQPPERFEYPIYKEWPFDGEISKFTSLTTRTVVVRGRPLDSPSVGLTIYGVVPHTNPRWKDCEKPAPKPLDFDGTPKWAMVSDADYYESAAKKWVLATNNIVFYASDSSNTEYCGSIGAYLYAWELEDE